MIERCSNKVRLHLKIDYNPWTNKEITPIKVLDIAPLIMVTLLTVSSFFSTCGCFLRGGRSPSGDLPPLSLSLACGWPPGANGSPLCEWRCLQVFRVEDPSGAMKGGANRPPKWAGPTGKGRPAQAHLRLVRSPLRSRGSSGDYALCPFHLHDFDDVILMSRWRFSAHEVRSFTLQSPGVFLHNTSVLATIGSDFIKLMNTNKTP
jgi:hypothetical protein